jgi:alpha-beta hydrolase superfamily lysophospholipase
MEQFITIFEGGLSMAAYEESTFLSITGDPLTKLVWRPDGTPKGVVQLAHGMAEHIRRYDSLAKALIGAGFAVVGHNHLGHGETAVIQGYFAKKGGWDALLADMHQVRLDTQKEYPGLPYFLLGHSAGSFLVRCYLFEHCRGLRGAILTGTGAFSKTEVSLGLVLSRMLILLGMGNRPAKLVDTLAFSANNKPFLPAQTPFDWLSRDKEQVQAYARDPMCGFPFTAKGYRDMFSGMKRMADLDSIKAMDKELGVLFLSGSRCSVGKNGAGMQRVADTFRNAGLKDITVKLYPEARHEVFNEVNRQEVYTDLINWLLGKCGS